MQRSIKQTRMIESAETANEVLIASAYEGNEVVRAKESMN